MQKVVVIAGPTAVGKTEYAIRVANHFDGEIISADSMQIYKEMNIGSAKPGRDDLKAVPHHMIGVVSPFHCFTVAEYQRHAKAAMKEILSRGKLPIISGGTGLYINSLIYEMDFAKIDRNNELRSELEGLAISRGKEYLYERLKAVDASTASRLHPNNVKKVIRAIEVAETTGKGVKPFEDSFKKDSDYEFIIAGLTKERGLLYKYIDQRVDEMVEKGLLDEVKALVSKGLTNDYNSMKGIGYKEIVDYLNGRADLEESIGKIKQHTRNYAKRQLTWFKRLDGIKWFDISGGDLNQNSKMIFDYINTRLLSGGGNVDE